MNLGKAASLPSRPSRENRHSLRDSGSHWRVTLWKSCPTRYRTRAAAPDSRIPGLVARGSGMADRSSSCRSNRPETRHFSTRDRASEFPRPFTSVPFVPATRTHGHTRRDTASKYSSCAWQLGERLRTHARCQVDIAAVTPQASTAVHRRQQVPGKELGIQVPLLPATSLRGGRNSLSQFSRRGSDARTAQSRAVYRVSGKDSARDSVPRIRVARNWIRLKLKIEIGLEFNRSEERKSISNLANFALIGQIPIESQSESLVRLWLNEGKRKTESRPVLRLNVVDQFTFH